MKDTEINGQKITQRMHVMRVSDELDDARAQLEAAGMLLRKLLEQFSTPLAVAPVHRRGRPSKRETRELKEKCENILKRNFIAPAALGRAVGASEGRIAGILKSFRTEDYIANVGTELCPVWTWKGLSGSYSNPSRRIGS